MTNPLTFEFDVVLFQEEGAWVAQCLNYDVAAQGNSLDTSLKALGKTLGGQIVLALHHNEEPFKGIPPAPEVYWEKFKSAARLEQKQPVFVPPAYMIHAMQNDIRIAA